MAEIFISYDSADRERVEPLALALEEIGWSVWWDVIIPPGRTFDDVIEEELALADCVIVIWTESSTASEWVRTEAADGKDRKILVPVLLDDVVIPLAFRRIHAANLTGWQAGSSHEEFDQLSAAIARHAPLSNSEIVTPAQSDEVGEKLDPGHQSPVTLQTEFESEKGEEETQSLSPLARKGRDHWSATANVSGGSWVGFGATVEVTLDNGNYIVRQSNSLDRFSIDNVKIEATEVIDTEPPDGYTNATTHSFRIADGHVDRSATFRWRVRKEIVGGWVKGGSFSFNVDGRTLITLDFP